MQGSSRQAYADTVEALSRVLGSADKGLLAEQLFSVTATIESTPALRRALADPSREAADKRGLAGQLFAGRVSSATMEVVESAVSARWAEDRDMTDALEDLGADAVLAAAEEEGRLDRVEDELFRFERLVAADQGLRDALINQDASTANKAALVSRLLDGKVAPEAVRLARQAVLAPRGRRFPQVIKEYLRLAARRREQLTAVVTSAIALDAAQHARLRAALSGLYGRPVFVTAVVNPELLGGVHVRIGDDVVDGTVARRLEDARRAMEG